ncbi:MAG: response regulator [Bacteroidetes bacterium]|nr:response regulator [Bacteroidota bacterium]
MKQPFRAIVIDDEPAARRLIRNLLGDYSHVVTIIDEAGNGREAITKIEMQKPDLIFLDIQMPDLTGFEVIEKLSYRPNIIFTTAYEQYAIKAFESFSIDYLLKPIKDERLYQSIEKLKQFGRLNSSINSTGLQEIISQLKAPPKPSALSIKSGDRIMLLRFESIVYMEAQDKYVYIYNTENQKYLTDQSLTALSEKLPAGFFRIQKSYIINKEKIKEMHKHLNGRYLFIMDDKSLTRITSGRTYHDEIKEEFGL